MIVPAVQCALHNHHSRTQWLSLQMHLTYYTYMGNCFMVKLETQTGDIGAGAERQLFPAAFHLLNQHSL